MTVIPEMREAAAVRDIVDRANADIHRLCVELAAKVACHEAECLALGLEIKALRDEGSADEAFLASQGYTRGEDGTWGGGRVDELVAALRDIAGDHYRMTTERDGLQAELAALRPVAEAAVALLAEVLREAVRALPPGWRG